MQRTVLLYKCVIALNIQYATVGGSGGLCSSEGVKVFLRIGCTRMTRKHPTFRYRSEQPSGIAFRLLGSRLMRAVSQLLHLNLLSQNSLAGAQSANHQNITSTIMCGLMPSKVPPDGASFEDQWDTAQIMHKRIER